jgi:electron transport complex protein RnfA
MNEYILILVSTILVNNFVLVKFLGLCPFMGVSKKVETAIGMGFATTFVLTLASVSSYLINTYILLPFEMEYLRTVAFIVAIAGVVGFTELVVNKTSPVLHQSLGVFLPLITTNCAVLGVALLNVNQDNGFLASAVYGFGAAIGFSFVLVLFSLPWKRQQRHPLGRLEYTKCNQYKPAHQHKPHDRLYSLRNPHLIIMFLHLAILLKHPHRLVHQVDID